MCTDICINILSDFLFLLLSVLVARFFYMGFRRRKLLNFFGIGKTKRIAIYISNLRIQPTNFNGEIIPSGTQISFDQYPLGGAFGIDGLLHSYSGHAIVKGELDAANQYRDLFNYFIPSLSDKSNILGTILLSDIKMAIISSPNSDAEIETSSTIISFGGPVYNVASSIIERLQNSQVAFSEESVSFTVEGIPAFTDLAYGFIERIFDKVNNRYCFYIAGLSEMSTVRAAQHLAFEWKKISEKHNDKEYFLIVLKFDSNNTNNWTVVLER
ncbi:MAG TPA: hypothetical protein PKW76_15495 [bacterium]|nr:hypothetical protein [bacterium]HPG47080.1 hypothetical protein [bacterium]HPM99332.1 hypothetical protein [bacterium]